MSIPFLTIPSNLRTHGFYIEYDNSRAVSGTPAIPHKILIVGHKNASGASMSDDTLTLASGVTDVAGKAGSGSNIHRAYEALQANNTFTECWIMSIAEDGSAVDATGSVDFTGSSATEDGTIYVMVGGDEIRVAVSSGDNASTIGDTFVAALTAFRKAVVTGSNSSGDVTVTARHGGTLGNEIDLRQKFGTTLPAGCSLSITGMASGANDPDVDDAIAAIGDVHFRTIISCFRDTTNLGKWDTWIEAQTSGLIQKDSMVFAGICDTQGNSTTAGNAENSKWVCLVGPGTSPSTPWQWAGAVGGINAFESVNDPARPCQSIGINGVLAPDPGSRFSQSERNTLLYDGISTVVYSDTGDPSIGRLITTYQTNALGDPDPSYLNVNTLRTLDYLRYATRVRFSQRYPRHKLGDDDGDYDPGQLVMTPNLARGELKALFKEWERAALVEDFDQFEQDLLVERNSSDPDRLDVRMGPNLMNQFRVFAGQIQFLQ